MESDLFQSLPTELVCMILSHLSTPQDLYSVIRASPSVYRGTFIGSKDVIIRNLAKNAFDPRVLPEALATVRFRQPDESPRGDNYEQRLTTILRSVRGAARPPIPTIYESIELCRLIPSFSYFVQDCTRRFLKTAQQELGGRKDATTVETGRSHKSLRCASLSQLEMARVQRAFLRYNTLRSFMHSPSQCIIALDYFTDIPAGTALAEFTPWEVEEIACVHQYFISRVRDIFNEVEDDFVESVASTEQPSTSKYLPLKDKNADLQSMEAEIQFFHDDLDDDPGKLKKGEEDVMFLDSEKDCQDEVIRHIAALGFPFLRNLCEADNARRNIMITENYWGKATHDHPNLFYYKLPQTGLFRREFQGRERHQKLKFEGDHYHKRNLGWLWANQMQPQNRYYSIYNSDLRSWGYVFWDSDRLEQLGVLKESRPEDYLLPPPPRYTDSGARPSAQRRLRELGLA
jgi:hypothetical protein